jgi:hypothetical protein
MKLDFLAVGLPDCPLLRLYDFTPAQAAQLLAALTYLASGAVQQVAVHELPDVATVGGCRLTLLLRSWDQAISRTGLAEFECALTAGTWDNVAGLVEPFAHGSHGFQWLAGTPGEATLLLSVSGDW